MKKIGAPDGINLIDCSMGSGWLGRMMSAAMGSPLTLWEEDLSEPCEQWTYASINGRRVLLAYDLDALGMNDQLTRVLEKLYEISVDSGRKFSDTVFGLLVTTKGDQFTKSSARSVIYLLNTMGIEFLGHPIVEATGQLENLSKWKKNMGKPEEEILDYLCSVLGGKLRNYGRNVYQPLEPEEQYAKEPVTIKSKKILVLHASERATSNTLLLWDMVRPGLRGEVEEIHLKAQAMSDCRGCTFEACLQLGAQRKCYFDDQITREVLPAIELADVVVWLCPNYNDTVGASIMTVINRLTVLYRRIKLDHKLMYALIVSGNSGGDCVANQLIGSLNVNKGMHLPGNFALIETANAPRSILSVKDVDARAEAFAQQMNEKIETFFEKVNPI